MKAKKSLGQHFLTDTSIAQDIVNALFFKQDSKKIDCLEIGPGQGVLTNFLLKKDEYNLKVAEIDSEAIEYLKINIPKVADKIIEGDILKLNFSKHFKAPLLVIGNLPYNITGPIFFKLLENKEMIQQAVVMIQKEVAQRIVSPPGSKVYGILSVLLQTFFKTEMLFTVGPELFNPPPKVYSSVIRLTKLEKQPAISDFKRYKNIVKAAFNQRRKTLRNAIKFYDTTQIDKSLLAKRAEQLSVKNYLYLYEKLK